MDKRYDVSVVAIFRNEHRFIQEWIDYHLKVGVDHFYLYDNGGDHRALLEPYESRITYTLWTDEIAQAHIDECPVEMRQNSRQTMAYIHCLKTEAAETRWLQLLDLDEYLVPIGVDDVREAVAAVEQESIGVIRVPRVDFGNNGRLGRPAGPGSIRHYLRRQRSPRHYKDMGIPEFVLKVGGPHTLRTTRERVRTDRLRVYQHYTRSLEDWLERVETGGGHQGNSLRTNIRGRTLQIYFFFLLRNLRSFHVLIAMAGLTVALSVSKAPLALWALHAPLIAVGVAAYQRGLNEVEDRRLLDLFGPDGAGFDLGC